MCLLLWYKSPFPQKAEFPGEPPSLPPLEALLAAYLLELGHNRAGNDAVCGAVWPGGGKLTLSWKERAVEEASPGKSRRPTVGLLSLSCSPGSGLCAGSLVLLEVLKL